MIRKPVTLRAQALLGGALLAMSILALAGGAAWSLLGLDGAFGAVRSMTDANRVHVTPLVRTVGDVRYNIIQVQQRLTDISATRGEDGLDDGPAEAAKNAKLVQENIDLARSHAQTLGLAQIDQQLQKIKAAFPAYYEQGQAMSRAYVTGGTSAGNQSMGAFDQSASVLANEVEALQGLMEDYLITASQAANRQEERVDSIMQMAAVALLVVSAVAIAILVLVINRQLTALAGLRRTADLLDSAAKGDLNGRLLNVWRHDELGSVQRSTNRILDHVEAYVRETAAALEKVSQGEYFRNIREEGMNGSFLTSTRVINSALDSMDSKISEFRTITQTFEDSIQTSVGMVGQSVGDLQAVSSDMHQAANENQSLSTHASQAMELASADVQAVAGASTQLSASILEISRQVSQATTATSKAVSDIESAALQVATLSQAARSVGEVIQIITDIASQTNLLALNATIEAARAGDAGKGFAVVANEVKSLAQQTAQATDNISNQIRDIQNATTSAVDAISGIGGVMGRINEVVTSVAAAVEEQEAATREINERVERVAVETQSITDNIVGVRSASQRTGAAAGTVSSSAQSMATVAAELNSSVSVFLTAVRQVV